MDTISVGVSAPLLLQEMWCSRVMQLDGVRLQHRGCPDVLLLASPGWERRLADLVPQRWTARAGLLLVTDGRAEETASALACGIQVLLHPDEQPDCLPVAIRAAAKRRVYFSPALNVLAIRAGSVRGAVLTEEERQLATMVAAGQVNRDIAALLLMAEITVKRRIGELCRKLGVPGKRELVLLLEDPGEPAAGSRT